MSFVKKVLITKSHLGKPFPSEDVKPTPLVKKVLNYKEYESDNSDNDFISNYIAPQTHNSQQNQTHGNSNENTSSNYEHKNPYNFSYQNSDQFNNNELPLNENSYNINDNSNVNDYQNINNYQYNQGIYSNYQINNGQAQENDENQENNYVENNNISSHNDNYIENEECNQNSNKIYNQNDNIVNNVHYENVKFEENDSVPQTYNNGSGAEFRFTKAGRDNNSFLGSMDTRENTMVSNMVKYEDNVHDASSNNFDGQQNEQIDNSNQNAGGYVKQKRRPYRTKRRIMEELLRQGNAYGSCGGYGKPAQILKAHSIPARMNSGLYSVPYNRPNTNFYSQVKQETSLVRKVNSSNQSYYNYSEINSEGYYAIESIFPNMAFVNKTKDLDSDLEFQVISARSAIDKRTYSMNIKFMNTYASITNLLNYFFSHFYKDDKAKAKRYYGEMCKHVIESNIIQLQQLSYPKINAYRSKEDTQGFKLLEYFFLTNQPFLSSFNFTIENFGGKFVYNKILGSEEEFYIFKNSNVKFGVYANYLPTFINDKNSKEKFTQIAEKKQFSDYSLEEINFMNKEKCGEKEYSSKLKEYYFDFYSFLENCLERSANLIMDSNNYITFKLQYCSKYNPIYFTKTQSIENIMLCFENTCRAYGKILCLKESYVDIVLGQAIKQSKGMCILMYFYTLNSSNDAKHHMNDSYIIENNEKIFLYFIPVIRGDVVDYTDPFLVRDINKILNVNVYSLKNDMNEKIEENQYNCYTKTIQNNPTYYNLNTLSGI